MDIQLIWSPQAIEDIEAIAEYIARDSTFYAESTVERIFQAPEKLLQFPQLGRVVPEKNDESIREIFVFQYRIIYEIQASEIHVLTVVHGKRILEDLI
ncbi:MAG: type II toxin-antitoxin system RelE/ParE family toxin [Sedimentisphaerales bacterium]|nr:type II toxin-antitoxin system RelE/ParE family toxin [Sedimentisphaerales bacterium]